MITLLTDFQVGNIYTPQMKGVIYSLFPSAQIVDVTDAIPPQDVMSGAVALGEIVPFFPAGTIHIAVVDPGVGSARKLLYLELGDAENRQILLAPDNGLVTILEKSHPIKRAFSLESECTRHASVSSTFHGRDILAPTAARLASGTVQPEELGPAVKLETLCRLAIPTPKMYADWLVGEVLYADSFGNLVTNITCVEKSVDYVSLWCPHELWIPKVKTYADAERGELVTLWGSGGRLEIAVVNGSAAQKLGFSAGKRWKVSVDNS